MDSRAQRAHHGWIMDGSEPVDEVVVTVFRNPNSYTGEDVVEVSCHGGAYVSRRIVQMIVNGGARPAEPGEFTQRAFLQGRMDLCQAEAVADLIQAKTEASRKVAAYQLEGRLSHRLEEMRQRLVKACSLLEIELDFSEEDVEFASRDELKHLLDEMKTELKSIIGSYDRGRVCREGIRMVIVGRPNVGKSSVLNALVERERAIVTEVPGTTRDTVEDVLDIDGLLFVITDTAGIREAEDPVEKLGVDRARQALDAADLVLLIFDGSEPLTGEDEALIRSMGKTGKKEFAVINKIDLPQKIDEDQLIMRLPEISILRVSALKRQGFEILIQKLEDEVLSGGIPEAGEVVITRLRHRNCMERTLKSVEQAEASLLKDMSQEFIVVDLRQALEALGEITGQTVTDDILHRIFSKFCIGK
jgi:tRNA modification GTPase